MSQLQRETVGLSYVLSEALPTMERLMVMRKREVKVVMRAAIRCEVYIADSEDTGNGKTPKVQIFP